MADIYEAALLFLICLVLVVEEKTSFGGPERLLALSSMMAAHLSTHEIRSSAPDSCQQVPSLSVRLYSAGVIAFCPILFNLFFKTIFLNISGTRQGDREYFEDYNLILS